MDRMSQISLPEKALDDFAAKLERRLIRRGPEQAPYLWRAYLGPVNQGGDLEGMGPDVGGFLHQFVSSDALTEVHCHPWRWSVAFILDGEYAEFRSDGSVDVKADGSATARLSPPTTKVYRPGDRNIIMAGTFHRVDILTPSVWTFFIHGPRVQPWGFVEVGRYDEELPVQIIKRRTFELPREQSNQPTGPKTKEGSL